MCEPATISLAIMAVGAAVGAAGAIKQGQAESASANFQAEVSRRNALIADQYAKDTIDRGKVDEQKSRLQTKQLIGRQRAVLAGNGVIVDEGSALDITAGTAEIGELDALTIRDNASREAHGYKVQGGNFQADASLNKLRARSATESSYFNAAGSLLGAGGQIAGKWYEFDKAGAFDTKSSYATI